ncbi:MAG: PP2C family protein-serine/threonine phosphatase [Phycisphaerae bacterium]|jgi:serine phosphatase RsbU (regulator of sigma subunit)|nr:PP2C family protein-serine/threonine phosphatase [Phycisphaerae bacterium]
MANGVTGVSESRSGIARRIVALAVTAPLVVALVLAAFAASAETAAAMRGVDAKLRAVAAGADALVAADAHARALGNAMDAAECVAQTARLTAVADEAGVTYLYTCVRPNASSGGLVYVELSSQSKEEREKGETPMVMRIYEQPPPELLLSLGDGATRFAEYTDEYGSFRSIFRPVSTAHGLVVIGADVPLDDLRAIVRANLLWQAGITIAVLIPVSLGALWIGRRVARPIVELASAVRSFSDDNFQDDAQSIERFERVVKAQSDETRTLAAAILDLRRRLVGHLVALTELTAEKERITAKLNIARDIQRGLLPQESPNISGFDIAGWSEAADETGGDFYDWMETPRGEIVLVVADVTGHGIGPSLMAAVCRAYARATLVESGPIEPLVERLNRLVHGDARSGQFVTFFAGVLDPASRKLSILSAAHGPILVYRASEHRVVETPTHGLPLGVVDDLDSEPGTRLTLDPGDILMVVSDGFFEWANREGEQFGHERLAAALLAASQRSSGEIIDAVRSEVYAFTTGTAQPDDMTALVVRCLTS